jgi:hypothetical protein
MFRGGVRISCEMELESDEEEVLDLDVQINFDPQPGHVQDVSIPRFRERARNGLSTRSHVLKYGLLQACVPRLRGEAPSMSPWLVAMWTFSLLGILSIASFLVMLFLDPKQTRVAAVNPLSVDLSTCVCDDSLLLAQEAAAAAAASSTRSLYHLNEAERLISNVISVASLLQVVHPLASVRTQVRGKRGGGEGHVLPTITAPLLFFICSVLHVKLPQQQSPQAWSWMRVSTGDSRSCYALQVLFLRTSCHSLTWQQASWMLPSLVGSC